MGIAVLSGVIDSLDATAKSLSGFGNSKWESHTPGTLTPVAPHDASVATRFIACVSREESANRLRTIFDSLGPLGETVKIVASKNVEAVQSADVILLWCANLFS